ncbi:hypothetical protein NYV35_25570 [Escherichia coli]|nr:hypothetical protein [Escherichia coli]
MELVGARDQGDLSEFILDRADEDAPEEEIIKEVLQSASGRKQKYDRW